MSFDLFIGRRAELEELEVAFNATQSGRGRICLCSGEPGIGKTRLAEALAARAREAGARVAWGAAWEGGAPGYWPWVQIVRRVADVEDAGTLWGALGGARHLAALGHGPHGEPVPDGESSRVALFDAVAALLRHAAARQPLLIVLDDLHAADVPSVLLLEFVAHELGDAPVLIVGTYRDVELERDPGRAAPLARLARHALHLPLGGWQLADVEQCITAAAQQAPAPSLIADVQARTGGNPFFIVEIVRQLTAQPSGVLPDALAGAGPLPGSVRQSIRDRLRPLDESARRTLEVASIIGRAFDIGLLSDAAEIEPAEALEHVAAAVAAGILMARRAAPPLWEFRHDLIRTTLYDDLPAAERPRLHQRVGGALERRHGEQGVVHLAEIAHHFRRGAACGDVGPALRYSERSARAAAEGLAFEEAAARYEDALELLAQARPADAAARADLLIALGTVRSRIASGAGRPAFFDAAAAARAAGDPSRIARAALGFADRGLGVPHRAPDDTAVALLEEALVVLPESAAAMGARLQARLAAELAVSDDRQHGDTLSAAAVELARRSGDRGALAHALSSRYFVLWRWDSPADRTALATELVRLAAELGDTDLAMQGRTWLAIDLMRASAGAELDPHIEAYERFAEYLREPRWRWMAANLRAMRALWCGEFDAAERHIAEAMAASRRVDDVLARINPLVQHFALRRDQGRLAEEEAFTRAGAEHTRNSPVPRTFLALLLCELGRTDEARPLFEALAGEDFADIERDRRIGVLPYLAEVCTALGDARRAVRLAELLRPHAEINLPYGASLCFGCGAHYLGLLASVQHDRDAAVTHLERALDLHTRMGAPPWLARTQLACAEALRSRGRPGDRERAETLRTAAEQTARALGMQNLLARAAAPARKAHDPPALASVAAEPRAPLVGGAPAPPTRGVFHHSGEHWTVGEGSTRLRLKDSKGMRYLAALLGRPACEIHVNELIGGDQGAARGAEVDVARRRLGDLRDALDEAMRFNDVERATRTRAEISLLAETLAEHAGIARHGGSQAAERARLNVSRTIADAIKRIAAKSPPLGRYFENTIRTGRFCSFTPDPRVPIEWDVRG
jgi:tetratricopeptide (TPR) repeat protein